MIEPRSIEELLEVAKLEEVAGQFLTLSQRGANRKADACPFCQAKKKFSVSIPKQLFHCFECGEGGGGALKFLMNAQRMEYLPAIKWLADYYKFILRDAEGGAAKSGDGIDTSYFVQRMQDIGYKQDRPADKGLFRPRTDGGIDIRYPNLYADGPVWQQHKDGDFVRTRLHPSRTKPGQKYNQESASGVHIFIPPVVVAEWRAGVKWETLFVVEGEFKAYAAAREGVPVVGIAGIKMYMDKKGSKNLHADLVQLLKQAAAVCLVHDADALQVKWDPVAEPKKDLGQRRRDFASAVTGFKMAVGTLVPRRYYARIHENHVANAKGLDDLVQRNGLEAVHRSLLSLRSNADFVFDDITNAEWRAINGIFHLNLYRGVPRAFYNYAQDIIADHPFYFCNGRYQAEEDEETGDRSLQLLQHPDSKQFVAVGCTFYKLLTKLDHNNRPQPYMEPWSESNLMRNYVRNGVPNFLHTLDTYDAFTVLPGHHEDFKAELIVQPEEFGPRSRFLNKYKPLDYQPREGKYPTIERFLKHIFGTDIVETRNKAGEVLAKSERWVVYLDRWTVMYREPRQRVPAVVLASEKRNTGKSTVLDLNMAMWGGNGVVIGNDAISSQFNANWIDCSYVGINEAMLKRREDGEKLKDMMTSPVTQRRGMYKDGEQGVNFTKFDITTNSPDKFLEISDDEYRYLVIDVPQYTGEEDPDLLKKMIAEIPALFHDLRTRKYVHPRVGRLWFANSVIDNEARRAAAEASRSWSEKELREWIAQQFYDYQWPELYYTIREIRRGVNDMNGARFRDSELKDVLKNKLRTHEEFTYCTVPHLPADRNKRDGQGLPVLGEVKKNRWYVFRAKDWVPEPVAKEMLEEAKAAWPLSANGTDNGGHPEEFKLHHPE